MIRVTHRGFPARYSSLLWLHLFVLGLPASIPEELNFLAGVRRHCGDNVLVLVFVHTENHGFRNVLLVVVDVDWNFRFSSQQARIVSLHGIACR